MTRRLPLGHTSVMAGRAMVLDDDQDGLRDFFPTPPWAARAGGELITCLDPDATTCWEPAAGEGHMVHGLADYFETVAPSDIHPFDGGAVYDFLTPGPPGVWTGEGDGGVDWIVTNPPFKDGEAFIRMAWKRARRGVAMLLRLAFVESEARYHLFNEIPLSVLAPFSERVPMVKGRWDPGASSATAYAWFIFLKPCAGGTAIKVPQMRLIPPGSKTRLTRESDLQRFGPAGGSDDLFEVRV